MTTALTVKSHLKKLIGEQDENSVAVPDSTTIIVEKEMCDFSASQDVLAKHKDGRYYFGTVVEADPIREQCLIKFGDNTNAWWSFKDLTKLSAGEPEDLLCVVCKKSAPQMSYEITVCDQCGRGYHEQCHQPEIPANCQKDGVAWMCNRCTGNQPCKRRKSLTRPDSSHDSPSSSVKSLPYDLNTLTWDTYHRVNNEQIYCYCGMIGEWFRQMLQCGRCKQWFHEKCVDCLKYPLYCGDRFYVYVCSICNHGKDFVRRLEMKWVDLVHLMLYNLTAFNSKKYYDLDSVVIPYINDNWHALQLPPKISNISKPERRELILSILTTNRNRFKCGKEIKKRTNIWGLRVRLPPPIPCITLPLGGQISEEHLREMFQGNKRLQFIEQQDDGKKIVPSDNHMRSIMMGAPYKHSTAHSESDSSSPGPDIEAMEDSRSESYKLIKPTELFGAGCVKKSVPFKKMSLQRRKKLLAMNNRERILRRPKRRLTMNNEKTGKEVIVAGAKRLSLDSKNSRNSETLPLTPPTSVSDPPTPPASGTTSVMSDLSNDYSESSNTMSHRLLGKQQSSDLNTPCDTSGDETSSKSTLDLIIPPPKDFEGKNNPFLTLLLGDCMKAKKKRKGGRDNGITLPLPLTAVIHGKPVKRPMKRQLSEKDIVIGPNGEVKRKKFKRNRSGSFTGQTASKTAAVVPVRPDGKEWGQRSSLDGRRLRQRPEREKQVEKPPSNPSTPKPSPVKQDPDISIDDLKTSVNIYFGAANRIATGERFGIVAKRIGPNGKMEYLIEWEGTSNGMT